MKPIATKNYARHEALDAVLGYSKQDGWGYKLTSELDKAHAYQCYHSQELANISSKEKQALDSLARYMAPIS